MIEQGLQQSQLFAIFFLLGAFTVKSLIELTDWTNRKEIWELWALFLVVFAVRDGLVRGHSLLWLGGKWGAIVLIALYLYLHPPSFLVQDDKVALLAAMSILSLIYSLILLPIYLILISLFKTKLRHQFSHRKEIPTLPLLTWALVGDLMIFIFLS